MKNFRISISARGVRNAITWFRNKRARRLENKLRRQSFKHKRYWRATSKSGTIDLGHMTEAEALAAVAKMGPVTYNDWPNAIIVYNDGSLRDGD